MRARTRCSGSCVRVGGAVWDTGIEFGTVGAAQGRSTVEITTFRADTYDRRVPQPRRSRSATRSTATSSAATSRSTRWPCASAPTGRRTFVDPLGGLAALARGVLDTPAAPEESFGDDPLRMLRAARFVSQLGFAVAPAGA